MLQLSFSFDQKNNFTEEDFLLLKENSAARNFLQIFFTQKNFTTSQLTSLILKGETCCGKSHLLNIFAQRFDAEFIDKEKINEANLINFFCANKFYILEDFEKIIDEELILRLINSAHEAKAFLVLSSNGERRFLLKDLNSRLKNIFLTEIKNPGYESSQQILANGFSRKQIILSKDLINLILLKIERRYASILAAIRKVESFCNGNCGKITIQDVKEIFKN